MFELSIENEFGKKLNLTNNKDYYVLSVEGLASLAGEVFTQGLAFKHGSVFKNSKVSERNIVITLKLNNDIEKSRINLYDFFKVGSMPRVYYRNNTRNVYIDAVVENIECDLFTENETMQISLLATQPFWMGYKSEIDASKEYSNFRFPFNINETGIAFSGFDLYKNTNIVNTGEVPTGLIIKIECKRGTVNNPVIYNAVNGNHFKINYSLIDGDLITIDTNKKTVLLERDAETFNLIGYKDPTSTWFQVPYGVSTFTYNADNVSENLSVIIETTPLFYGV